MMAKHATRSRRLKTAEMVHARSTPPPSAQLDSNGRAPNTPVGTGAGHRRSENWLAVPFSVPSDSHPFIPRAIVADISGLENRCGLSVHRGFESPPLRLETADSLLRQGTRSFLDRSGHQSRWVNAGQRRPWFAECRSLSRSLQTHAPPSALSPLRRKVSLGGQPRRRREHRHLS